MTLVIILPLSTLLHGILMRVVTELSPLGGNRPLCSMTPKINKTIKKKNILPDEATREMADQMQAMCLSLFAS